MAFRAMRAHRKGFAHGAAGIFEVIRDMPNTARRLAWVQMCIWMGLCCNGIHFVPVVAHNVFTALDEKSSLHAEGVE